MSHETEVIVGLDDKKDATDKINIYSMNVPNDAGKRFPVTREYIKAHSKVIAAALEKDEKALEVYVNVEEYVLPYLVQFIEYREKDIGHDIEEHLIIKDEKAQGNLPATSFIDNFKGVYRAKDDAFVKILENCGKDVIYDLAMAANWADMDALTHITAAIMGYRLRYYNTKRGVRMRIDKNYNPSEEEIKEIEAEETKFREDRGQNTPTPQKIPTTSIPANKSSQPVITVDQPLQKMEDVEEDEIRIQT